jgi:hypothetical protein
MRAGVRFLRRTVGAVRIAVTDERIPRPLRWAGALGLLPIPGPLDEVLLVLVAVPLGLFYRRPLADAWSQAGRRQDDASPRP